MSDANHEPIYWTRKVLAERYCCAAQTLANYPENYPPFRKIGGKALYPVEEVLRWEAQQPLSQGKAA